jgi:hypothetical protein
MENIGRGINCLIFPPIKSLNDAPIAGGNDYMKKNLTHKILEAHLIEGRLLPGNEIAIRIDHTLLHDATGTLPCWSSRPRGLTL